MLVCFKGSSSGFPTRHQITVEALCLDATIRYEYCRSASFICGCPNHGGPNDCGSNNSGTDSNDSGTDHYVYCISAASLQARRRVVAAEVAVEEEVVVDFVLPSSPLLPHHHLRLPLAGPSAVAVLRPMVCYYVLDYCWPC